MKLARNMKVGVRGVKSIIPLNNLTLGGMGSVVAMG